MNKLTIITGNANQTPIEIALGIDENGMTTAMKLYEFLQMDKSNYARWCKRNITDNPFAEENVDFWAFVRNDEWGGQATTDYRLTAKFAKKLSMMQKNERGEQAREYFTKVEEMAVNMTNSVNRTLVLELQTLKQELSELRSGFVALQDSTSNSEMTMSDIKKIKTSVYKKVLEVTGGKDANAYRNSELLHKVFTSIYSTTNYKMGVKTYKQIRHNQVDRYIQTVKRYDAPVELLCEIMLMNEEI